MSFSINRVGHLDREDGSFTLGGRYRCTEGQVTQIQIEATQERGRHRPPVVGVYNIFVDSVPCDGSTRAWSLEILPVAGRFTSGPVSIDAFGLSCNSLACAPVPKEVTIRLRAGHAGHCDSGRGVQGFCRE